jgi:hypothetical protein
MKKIVTDQQVDVVPSDILLNAALIGYSKAGNSNFTVLAPTKAGNQTLLEQCLHNLFRGL